MPPDLERRIAERAVAAPPPPVRALADALFERGGGAVEALLFFGSRRSGAATDAFSAYDFFVVVDSQRAFYEGLRRAGALRRAPWLMATLGAVLPPSQVSFRLEDGSAAGLHGKLAVLSSRQLERETSPRRRDHFCVARLFQPTLLARARDEAAAARALLALAAAHRATFEWSRPWLPEDFDAADYARRLLEVSLRAEIRPELPGRAAQLFEAQREYLQAVYPALLDELAADGRLLPAGTGRQRLARPASALERWRLQAYFRWSLVRATLRWGKHMLTFEGWLDYIARKVMRHAGQPVDLSERERRWPLLFLWPRVYRYLRDKNRMGK